MSLFGQAALTAFFVVTAVDKGLHADWSGLAVDVLGIVVTAFAFAYFRHIEDMVR